MAQGLHIYSGWEVSFHKTLINMEKLTSHPQPPDLRPAETMANIILICGCPLQREDKK